MLLLQNKNNIKYFPGFLEALGVTFLLLGLEYVPSKLFPGFYNSVLGNFLIRILAFSILIFLFLRKRVHIKEVLINKKYNDWIIPPIICLLLSLVFLENLIKEIELNLKYGFEFYKNYFDNTGMSGKSVLTALLLAPFIEEIFFRGILLNGFIKNYGERNAIILSSLIFAICHFERGEDMYTKIISAFLFAGLQCIIILKTKNMAITIFSHFFYNLSIFIDGIMSYLIIKITHINDLYYYLTFLLIISFSFFYIGYTKWKKVVIISGKSQSSQKDFNACK